MKVEIIRSDDLPVPVVRREKGCKVTFYVRSDLITPLGAMVLAMASNAALADRLIQAAS